ncbi:class I adenylate cyclase [Solidesulfovibrio sp.]|uniref:class I adenylate cyclase n=1 Tax=Solidesulfovibrio sp. TaxID=2910990 RepID=UPI002624F85D|nr:class I adenylate cyclase [Solidesulfovibrio sp.]
MKRPGSPARAIMRTLRTGLSQPPGSDLTSLVPLARQTLAFIDRGAADDPATAGEASELAFLLAALLEAGDEAFARQAFGLLFRLGVEGEVLSVIHLEKMPEDQALSLLGCLKDEEKLLFVNAFFRRPRPSRPKTAAFGLSVLADLVERTPDELLILLDLLANRHEYPALPVRNALVRGRLGMWLHQLLQMDLSAEQTRYMARVVGRLREPTLVQQLAGRLGELDEISAETVCRALAETPGLDPAVVAGPVEALCGATDPSLAAAALSALARCDEPRAATVAAGLLTASPDRAEELAPFLAGLSLAAFGQALRGLPTEPRRLALGAVYAVLAAAAPGAMETAARAVAKTAAATPELARAMAGDLALRSRAASRPFPPRAPLPGPAQESQEQKGLWKRVKTLVAAPGPGQDGGDEALRRDLAQGGELNRRQILWTRLEGAAVTGVAATRCVLRAVDLSQAAFSEATFTDCQFTDVAFDAARLRRVAFAGCRFANCRFSGTVLEQVRFESCELRGCAFDAARGEDVTLSGVDVTECDFFGASLAGFRLETCRFRAVSLVRAAFHDLAARGALFSDCLFEMAAFPKADLAGVRTEGCYFAGARFGGVTDEPDILGAMAKDDAVAMAEAAVSPPLPAALLEGGGPRLLAACLDAALFARDVARRRRAMLASNKRRAAWARRRLGDTGAAFLDMLSGLVEAGLSRDADGKTTPAPAARVAGFHPDLSTCRLLARHFGLARDAPPRPPDDALPVEAVYTIGSVGTVAQGADSDLDVWVCLGPAAAQSPHREAFAAKLEAASRAAMQEAGLEIHFFCMSVQDVRDNVFGYSDDEGYGSAQGRLLKEEFYRTALVVGGRKPAWWCLAPGVGQEVYDRALAAMARVAPEADADSLDFGCLQPIAGDEYFGASLWMIVKSLTSPFKSIIKFGLLEKYAAQPGAPEPLCDTLKQHVFANQGGLWRCDPYALLFREVTRFYQEGGRTGAVELLRQAFLQKTGFDPSEEYASRTGETLLDHYFPYAPPAAGLRPPPPRREGQADEDGFAQAQALGEAIAAHFLRAYERLKERSKELASGGGLTERDQTMLSRRIAASFGRKVGKIMRMPFVRPGRDLFASLEIAYEEIAPREKGFTVRAEPAGPDRKARRRETVRQDASLPRLCAWLVANEIYRPGMHLKAAALPAPLTLPDVTGLLDAVYEAFPVKDTFAPPLSLGLSKERITTALCAVNLLSPREDRRTLTVDALYATTWGELFHLERAADLDVFDGSPPLFLKESTTLGLDHALRLTLYAPAKSQCPTARDMRR